MALNQLGSDLVSLISAGQYAQMTYNDGAGVVYVCLAAPGTALTAAQWQISKVDSSTSPHVRVKWCDGNNDFDNVATDLATVAALAFT